MKHLTPKATRLMRKKTQKECAEALHDCNFYNPYN